MIRAVCPRQFLYIAIIRIKTPKTYVYNHIYCIQYICTYIHINVNVFQRDDSDPLLSQSLSNLFVTQFFWIKTLLHESCTDSIVAMTEKLLQVATAIAVEVATWSPRQQDRLECCREFCRSVCAIFGHDEKTACLANLWIVLTMIDCRLGGCSGSDIDITGMALPKTSRPWNEWDKLNYYQHVQFSKEIYIMQNVLPQLSPHAPELLEDVLTLCKEIKAMMSVSSQ